MVASRSRLGGGPSPRMRRVTVADAVASRLPGLVGLCADDLPGVCAILNSATERLLYAKEVGDESWIGGWAELALTASQDSPFVTLPYGVSMIEALDVCTFPVPVRNQFAEYLRYGFGRWPKSSCATTRCSPLEALDRGNVPLFSDIVPPDKLLRVRLTDGADEGKRVLVQGLDANSVPIRTLDGTVQVDGEFLELTAPFVDSSVISVVTGIQKDITLGQVAFYEYDTVSTDERLVLTMQPGETVAGYRRYYVSGLPTSCCPLPPTTPGTVQLTALVKLDFVPVRVLTDYLLIPNIEALTHEAQAIRFSGMDSPSGSAQSAFHHREAIRLLQGQSIHEFGKLSPAVNFAPFGTARLSLQRVGTCW